MNKFAFNILGTPYNVVNPIGNKTFDASGSLGALVSAFLNVAIIFAGILLLIWLIIGAFEWMTSSGDKEKLTKARNRIVSAIIGFVIIIMAFTLQLYIHDILNPNPNTLIQPVLTPEPIK